MTDPIWLTVDDSTNRLDEAIRCLRLTEEITPDHVDDPATLQALLVVVTEHLIATRNHLHQTALEIKGEPHLTTI